MNSLGEFGYCSCGPEAASARLIGDEAYCNECDGQVRPKGEASPGAAIPPRAMGALRAALALLDRSIYAVNVAIDEMRREH